MVDRNVSLLKRCAIAFVLLGLVLVPVAGYLHLHGSAPLVPATGACSVLDGAGRYAAAGSLLFATLAILTTLMFFILRFRNIDKTLQQRGHQLESLALANQRINENLEVPAVMRALVESALELTNASDGAAGMIKDGQMVFTEYYKSGTWIPIDFSFPPGYGVPGWVIDNKAPYLSNDARNDPQVIQEIREQLGFYNLVDTPILSANGELIGCFEIHNTRDRRPFDEQDVSLLKGLSANAAVAIQNARFIAAQLNTEMLLRASENKFRSLFENSPISLWEEDFSAIKLFIDELQRQGVSDLNDYFAANPQEVIRCASMVKVADVNQATVELYAARSKEDLLSHLGQVFTKASLPAFIQGIIALASGRTQYRMIGINKTLNGEELEANIYASIIPGCEDTWQKVIVSVFDVTREREIDRLKNEFISTAAHELRTPLTVIMGYTDLLLEHLESATFTMAEKREFLASINVKAGALERIVEDLLDVSKIESGRQLLLEKEPARICGLLAELIANHQRETDQHTLVADFGTEDFPLLIDPGRISQVIDNLLSNAIKYSPQGGEIKVRVQFEPGEVDVSVSDQGIGMTVDQAARIFDKFYRADTSNTALGGLGLGMNIARNIVEAHGGQIWVKTSFGQGTTVHFTLPMDFRGSLA